MPTYEFECGKCGKSIELFLHFDDPPPKKCKCGGKLNKVFSSVGIAFKGSGFYCTDSKGGNGSQKAAPAEKAECAEKTDMKDTTAKDPCKDCKKSPEKSKEQATV